MIYIIFLSGSTDTSIIQPGSKGPLILHHTLPKCGCRLSLSPYCIDYSKQSFRRFHWQGLCTGKQIMDLFLYSLFNEVCSITSSHPGGNGCIQSCHSPQVHWIYVIYSYTICPCFAPTALTVGLLEDIQTGLGVRLWTTRLFR